MNLQRNIFSLKREVEDTLSMLESAPSPLEAVEDGARRLAEMGERATPFVARYLEKAREHPVVERVVHLIELTNDCSYAAMLEDLLLRRSFKDAPPKLKIELLATLKSYGNDLASEVVSNLFEDPEEAYLSWIRRVLEDFESREFRVISLLEEFLGAGGEMDRLIRKVGETFREDAIPLLSLLAGSDNSKVSLAAIKELGRIRDDRAVSALKGVIRYSWRKESVEESVRALRRLSFSGHDTECAQPPGNDSGPDVYKVFLGPVDGMGNTNLLLAVKKGNGRVDTLFAILNDEAGIVDLFGSKNVKEQEFSKMVGEIREESFLAEGEVGHFVDLLNDALYQSERNGIPLPPEFHYRKGPLEGQLRPKRFSPEFGASILKRIKGDPTLLERGAELFDNDEFGGWIILTPRVFDYAEKLEILSRGSGRLSAVKEKRILGDFCREILSPMRGQISRRLFLMADFLFKTGRSKETAELTLATAIGLDGRDGMPLTEVPFLTRLARESIIYCREALEEGVDLRDLDDELDWADE